MEDERPTTCWEMYQHSKRKKVSKIEQELWNNRHRQRRSLPSSCDVFVRDHLWSKCLRKSFIMCTVAQNHDETTV